MKVKAIKDGYDGAARRKAGDVFHWPAGVPLGKWVQIVEKPKPAAKPKAEALETPASPGKK